MIEQQPHHHKAEEEWILLKKGQTDLNGLSHSDRLTWSPGSMPK